MPNWKGSTRRDTLPPDWYTVRRPFVLNRDGHRCQHVRYDTGRKCGARANQVDHIDDRDDHSYRNLRSLCEWHHNQKSGRQGGTASQAARRRNQPAPKRHPGILP
jgi:5-methylcytosine-specific restriction endonuclease McrA